MTKLDDGIKVGDMFNAYVLKSKFSKTLSGKEGAGKLVFDCPIKATKVTRTAIESEKCVFSRQLFRFEKIRKEK